MTAIVGISTGRMGIFMARRMTMTAGRAGFTVGPRVHRRVDNRVDRQARRRVGRLVVPFMAADTRPGTADFTEAGL